MKLRRIVVFSFAALLLATGLWVVGGNMWAARKEEQYERAWIATFGSLEDLKKKYPKRDTNETAKKLEQLTRGTVFDLTPVVGSVEPEEMGRWDEWNRSQGTVDYLLAQIARPEASIDPPSENVIRFLEEKRVILDAIESILAAGPPPQWALDLSFPENARRKPNALGQIRLQRILTARALAAEQRDQNEFAARSLDASWNLNESLRGRPEIIPALLSTAIARFQVGILRKVTVEENGWRKRLETLDGRTVFLDADVILGVRPKFARTWWRYVLEEYGEASWFRRAWQVLEAPAHRVANVEYSDLMRDELSHLRDAPLSDHFSEPPAPDVYTRNSFLRADRLVVDAELTSKILQAKSLRRKNAGRWPAAIPGIEASRYPGASWRYEVSPDGGGMSIALSRELASPYPPDTKLLPLRFSSN